MLGRVVRGSFTLRRFCASATQVQAASPKHETSSDTSSETPDRSEGKDVVLCHVTPKATLHKVAGRIAGVVREHTKDGKLNVPFLVKATGTNSVNAAVKSMHVARQFLSETPEIGLSFRVNHEDGAVKERISQIRFAICASPEYTAHSGPADGIEEMWVKSSSRGRSLGRHIATSLDNAEKARIVAIGPRSVGNTVVGLTWARRILRSKGLDAIAVPQMATVSLTKGEQLDRTAVQFTVHRIPWEKLDYLDPIEESDVEDEKENLLEEPA